MLKEVKIGSISIGGDCDIAIQSMSNIAADNLEANMEQCRRLYQQGCKIIRFATSKTKDIKAIALLKKKLQIEFPEITLVADTHFSPLIAELAVEIFDKVRINPGNFVDRNTGNKPYSDKDFEIELRKIETLLVPFLQKCKKSNTSIRIGTNHGSLSERIMQKYGDTPKGMVASVEEYLQICKAHAFHSLVLSLKSSSTINMIKANRLMVRQILKQNIDYPLHLGVTEAGNGDEARIKSALGIGTLLLQGIGDTIRVSLTEAPEKEIPAAQKILKYSLNKGKKQALSLDIPKYSAHSPFDFQIVGINISNSLDTRADIIFSENLIEFINPLVNKDLFDTNIYLLNKIPKNNTLWQFVYTNNNHLNNIYLQKLKQAQKTILILKVNPQNYYFEILKLIKIFNQNGIEIPLIFEFDSTKKEEEDFIIQMSVQIGALLANNIGNGIILKNPNFSSSKLTEWAFMLLQAAEKRRTMPEIVACPSCGRTLFDIEKTLNRVKELLPQIKNAKIAIMGCIINGLGEMADADYAFVGIGRNKISLYYRKKLIAQNIASDKAIPELLKLMKEKGDLKKL